MARSPDRVQRHASEDDDDDDDVLFTIKKNGKERRARFYLYRVPETRVANLEAKIVDHGGEIIYDKEERTSSDVILTYNPDDLLYVEDKFCQYSRTTYARRTRFVDECINGKRFELAAPIPKGMPGRPPGKQRVPYTTQDDENLVRYLGEVVPFKEQGGRKGKVIYENLWNNPGVFPWGQRHSPQSWRNRYKSHEADFDERIDDYVEKHPPEPNGKGQYARDARLRKGSHAHPIILDSEDEDEPEEVLEDEVGQGAAAGNRHVPRGMHRQEEEEEDSGDEVQIVKDVPASYAASHHSSRERQAAVASRKRARATDDSGDDRLPANQVEKRRRVQARPVRPQGEAEEDQQHSHLEDGTMHYPGEGEAGPSQSRRHRAAAASQSHAGRTSPVTQAPTSSQTTLVGTQPAPQAAKRVPQRQPALPRQSARAHQAQPDTRKQTIKKTASKQRLPPSDIPVDAPSRNTRARSKSVDPPVQVEGRTRVKGKGRAVPVLEEVVEEPAQEEERDADIVAQRQDGHAQRSGHQQDEAHDETMEVEAELEMDYDSDERHSASVQGLSEDEAQASHRPRDHRATPVQTFELDSDDEIVAVVAPRSARSVLKNR